MPCYFYTFTSSYTLYKRDMSGDIGRNAGGDAGRDAGKNMGRDVGRDAGRVKREVGGRGEGEAVKRGSLGRKIGLGKQCLSFGILFLAAPFLLLFPSSTSYYILFLF